MTGALTPAMTAAMTAAVGAAVHAAIEPGPGRAPRSGGPDQGHDEVVVALRLGWAMAEARGRSWPHGPKPSRDTELPPPEELQLLPLRYQRGTDSSRSEAVSTLLGQLGLLRFSGVDELGTALRRGEETISETDWPSVAATFKQADTSIQDELASRDDALANGYLLGRGLAECYWGLGPKALWRTSAGVSPAYLLGAHRRRELTRMLGRLSGDVDVLTPSTIAGSIEAWGEVAHDAAWSASDELEGRLYEQIRRWYQLLVLGQDPTILVKPGDKLGNAHYYAQTAKAFWGQGLLALLALGLSSTFVAGLAGEDDPSAWLSTLLGTGGVGAFALAGLLTKGQSAAQQLLARMRQDAYTDLLAVSLTAVPGYPGPAPAPALALGARPEKLTPAQEVAASDLAARRAAERRKQGRATSRAKVERAVRNRRITSPTPPPAA